MLRPGQEMRNFTILHPEMIENSIGREIINQYQEIGKIRAILAAARSEEVERWRQLNHPISHKIIMKGKPSFDIRAGDIFEYGGRRFYATALPYEPGNIGHWTIFYCNERADVL